MEKIVRAWRRIDLAEEKRQAIHQQENRHSQTETDENGMLVIRGRLTPEAGALLLRALEAAQEQLYRKTDRDTSAETSRRIACDAGKVVMLYGPDGSVLDVGRKTRTVPPAIRRALLARDKSCRFPGCASKFCHAHHLEHWANGGETKLSNLALLCNRHHVSVHERGFRVERVEGDLRFYHASGRLIHDAPARPSPRDLDIIDAPTVPWWTAEPLNLDWAMAVLRQ